MDNPAMDHSPPPYSEANETASPAPVPDDPPPKYEPPKDGLYASEGSSVLPPAGPGQQLPAFPPAGQQYPIQTQPGYGATVTQAVVITDAGFGASPCTTTCIYCHEMMTTNTTYVTGGLTWLTSGVICLFGCWLGCCLIPFCIPELQDVEHFCPKCNRLVGRFHRL